VKFAVMVYDPPMVNVCAAPDPFWNPAGAVPDHVEKWLVAPVAFGSSVMLFPLLNHESIVVTVNTSVPTVTMISPSPLTASISSQSFTPYVKFAVMSYVEVIRTFCCAADKVSNPVGTVPLQ